MSILTTQITRVARRVHDRRRALGHLAPPVRLLVALAAILLIAVFAPGPRIMRGSRLIGVELGGLRQAEAVRALGEAFSAKPLVSLELPGRTLRKSLPELGFAPDFEATVRPVVSWIWRFGRPEKLEIRGTFDDGALSGLVRDAEPGLPRPKDARIVVDGNQVRVEPGSNGLVVDEAVLRNRVRECASTMSVGFDIPLRGIEPPLTTKAAKAMNINRLLASYTTSYVEDQTRSYNIKLATSRISGGVLAPGDKLSFNERVGPRDDDDGYKEANVFVGNKIEKGYGGGVCQVSTTLYNAALLANVEIVERYSHSMIVDYVPLGRDASVSYGELDLIIRNNSQGHIMIVGETRPGVVTFKVFGDGPDVKVTVESKVLSKTDFVTETIQDPALPKGQKEVTQGKTGYRVVSYKIISDGKREISRSVLNYSSYKPMNQVIREGTKT